MSRKRTGFRRSQLPSVVTTTLDPLGRARRGLELVLHRRGCLRSRAFV